MNNPVHISTFLLERYHIGEVNPVEKLTVEQALATDPVLAESLAQLDQADRDFRERFPHERLMPEPNKAKTGTIHRFSPGRRFRPLPAVAKIPAAAIMACAAALILAVALPILIQRNPFQTADVDRIKGSSGANATELSLFLEEKGENKRLADQTGIRAGNTVQLAYRVQPGSSGEKYGVIFSIDGNAVVTLHYPYSAGQNTQLSTGATIPLNEAYTLDDAPLYEIFFFVVGDKPMEAQKILNTAQWLAFQIGNNTQGLQQKGKSAFGEYELQILTLIKERDIR